MPSLFNFRTLLCIAALGTTLTAAAQDNPPSETVSVVAQLYRDFAWEVVIEEPGTPEKSLLEQPREVLTKYFDDNLTALFLKDRACVNKTGELCNLDYSPIWAAQDPAAAQLKVLDAKKPGVVIVKFRQPAEKKNVELSYRMTKTKQGWRISDITERSYGSLVSNLSRKL